MKYSTGMVANFSRLLDGIAGLSIVLIMLVVVINIILRAVFKQPLIGTVDYVNILTAVSIGLAIAYCAVQDGHIAIGFIVDKIPEKARAALAVLVNLLALIFWCFTSWYMLVFADSMNVSGLVASTSQIPLSPVVYIIALGLIVVCLVILLNLIESVRKVIE